MPGYVGTDMHGQRGGCPVGGRVAHGCQVISVGSNGRSVD